MNFSFFKSLWCLYACTKSTSSIIACTQKNGGGGEKRFRKKPVGKDKKTLILEGSFMGGRPIFPEGDQIFFGENEKNA